MTTAIIIIVCLAALAFGIGSIFRWYNSAMVAGARTDRVSARQGGWTARLKARLAARLKRRGK